MIDLPKEIGELTRLRELHLQGNRLTILPPEIGNYIIKTLYIFLNNFYNVLGNLDMTSQKAVFKLEGNEWVTPIADQLQVGINHLAEYLRTETYRMYVIYYF